MQNNFDFVLYCSVIIGGLAGFRFGLFRSALDIAAIFIGLLAAIAAVASPDLVKLTGKLMEISSDRLAAVALMIAVFVVVQVLIMLAGLVSVGDGYDISVNDRLLGALLGAGRGFLLFVMFNIASAIGLQYAGLRFPAPKQSVTYPAVMATSQAILQIAIPLLPKDIAAAARKVQR
jgi:uncharacterized membrane protein required for colicin V production